MPIVPALSSSVVAYAASDIAAGIKVDGEELGREIIPSDKSGGNEAVRNELPNLALETLMLR